MKYILTDLYDEERVWIHKNKDQVIEHLLQMLGDMKLEREE